MFSFFRKKPAASPAIQPETPPQAAVTPPPALPPYDAGTTYPSWPQGATPTSDPLLGGYSTRIAPWYVKTICQGADKGPDACLVMWEKSWGLAYPDGYKP